MHHINDIMMTKEKLMCFLWEFMKFTEFAPLRKVNMVVVHDMFERRSDLIMHINMEWGTKTIIIWYAHMFVFHTWKMRTFDNF